MKNEHVTYFTKKNTLNNSRWFIMKGEYFIPKGKMTFEWSVVIVLKHVSHPK